MASQQQNLQQERLAPCAILLDKDGVLVDFHTTWKPAIKQAAVCVAIQALKVMDGNASSAPEEDHDAFVQFPASDQTDIPAYEAHFLATNLLQQVGYDAQQDSFLPGSIWAAGTQEELFDTWSKTLPALPRQRIAKIVSEVLRAAEPKPVVPASRLLPLMRQVRARGCKLAVVTNDLTASAQATARRQGMADLLDAVIGADQCARPKPHPDLVWHASRMLGIPPQRMLMIGDNMHDAEMARRGACAGFIGVLSGTSGHDDLAPLADAVVEDVAAALKCALQYFMKEKFMISTP